VVVVLVVLRLVLAFALAAVPNTCGLAPMTGPGQVDYHATLTVLNRTEADVIVTSQQRSFTVPACSEATEQDFPINWWDLTSPGRDTFHSGGGEHADHLYLVVTSVVEPFPERPASLPNCGGLLQPG
jgi:hypothetical protein